MVTIQEKSGEEKTKEKMDGKKRLGRLEDGGQRKRGKEGDERQLAMEREIEESQKAQRRQRKDMMHNRAKKITECKLNGAIVA